MTVLERRAVRLDGVASNVRSARQVLRDVLRGTAAERWLDAAELACTEVVSNVVLHAGTAMELTVSVQQDQVRVEVRDFCPTLPVPRFYGQSASTGRGMALVAALTSAHGIADAGPEGKTVWFVVSDEVVAQSEQDLLAAWDDAEWDVDDAPPPAPGPAPVSLPPPPAATSVVVVTLLGLPPALWMTAREHHDALLRELALYLAGLDGAAPSARVDLRRVDLTATELTRSTLSGSLLGHVPESPVPEARVPMDGGTGGPQTLPSTLDLSLNVPVELSRVVRAAWETLDVAEQLAASGALLQPPGSAELVAIRDWVCLQVIDQLAGQPPVRWAGSAGAAS